MPGVLGFGSPATGGDDPVAREPVRLGGAAADQAEFGSGGVECDLEVVAGLEV